MPLPESVAELVARFAENRSEYRKSDYNETQTRIDYVNPLFAALGWDMDNHEGLSELHREVIHEAKIKIGGTTKAPDYSFRAGGDRKFFVETKKPTVSLDLEQAPAYQIRRYGWTAKLPLSILTNFEEFAIYDTRIAPDQKDSAKAARLDHFKYTDYAEKWDDLYSRFSREAVFSGAFDKYAAEARDKRISVPVDKAFLAEISGWREKLARNIVQRNPGLGPRELNYAVQMIIDRIIFLRISEDRGAEPDHLLQPLMNNGGPVYPRLLDIFRRADARYNSGLFHFDKDPKREEPDDITPHLTIDDRPLKEIIASVYYPESPFEFSVFPADILGQVYEQFLGKVIRISGKSAEVEDKPEVKKAGGVYYTPTYIVDYIVRNTVGKQVEGKTPAQVAKLTILDPACGSGSFLIGAYQFLLDWHLKFYTENDRAKWAKGKNATIYQFRTDAVRGELWRLTTAEKKRILLNNIYGVDIDTQAVEVTKLSLLLKVLEGESAELIDNSLKIFQERALPDLEHNIKCGNSLIGPDFYTDKDMALFDMDTRLKINTFDWKTGFPTVMKAGGFDAVIGNPPYIGFHGFMVEKGYLRQSYASAKGKFDYYLPFIEKGISLNKKQGLLSYICPTNFMKREHGKALRTLLKKEVELIEICDFQDVQVFTGALNYTGVYIFENKLPVTDHTFNLKERSLDAPARQILQNDLSDAPWVFRQDGSSQFIDRVQSQNVTPLGEITTGISEGIVTGQNQVFLVDRKQADEFMLEQEVRRPCIRGRQIRKYWLDQITEEIIYPYHLLDKKTKPYTEGELKVYPQTLSYLRKNRQLLTGRSYFEASSKAWYELWCQRDLKQLARKKIVVAELSDSNRFCIASDKQFYGDTVCGITLSTDITENIHYVLGLLNSRLIEVYYKRTTVPKANGFFIYKTMFLKNIPIRRINFLVSAEKAKHDKMVQLVEQILTLHTEKAAARLATEKNMLQQQIEATDAQIDRLVYDLYGLTSAEIAIVEGAK